ncbi:hypothetical protein [Robiginitomaculum antarcticum]|uniref:hypothetical protein n=1 Tax=Robiginitomaculum antarcticum TaxID=437507 RepID=UPI0003616437|nr:hypothetical protein [Robiginitomaculum antarcticum]
MSEKKSKSLVGLRLEDYVSQTCIQILMGVVKAQDNSEIGSYIGRASRDSESDENGNSITNIEFSIVSEVSSNKNGGLELTVPMLAAKVGAGAKINSENKILNTLNFNVPIAFPKPSGQIVDEEDLAQRQSEGFQRISEGLKNMKDDGVV